MFSGLLINVLKIRFVICEFEFLGFIILVKCNCFFVSEYVVFILRLIK